MHKLAAKALEGDLGAIREIFDRIDGKAGEQSPRTCRLAASLPDRVQAAEMMR